MAWIVSTFAAYLGYFVTLGVTNRNEVIAALVASISESLRFFSQ
jgi:hypothetical protein